MQKILRAIPLDDDEGLDEALRDVPVPVSLARLGSGDCGGGSSSFG